jgi:hypothetical protein
MPRTVLALLALAAASVPARAQSTSFCFGDGSVVACPCANDGLAGRGCDNAAATGGARLTVTGTAQPDTIVLLADGVMPGSLAIFLQGDAAHAPVPWGDGLRCVGGNLVRLTGHHAFPSTTQVWAPHEPGLDPSISALSALRGDPLGPGAIRSYQVYYRDAVEAFCPAPQGATWNATNAVRIVW